jgi:hypothetical protein
MKFKMFSILIILTLAGIFLLYPVETNSVPEWKIQVVDSENNSMSDLKVRQIWSISGEHNEEDLITDLDGFVTFPKRLIRQPRLLILLQKTISKISYYIMPHGAVDCPCSSVFPASGARTNLLNYYEGKVLEHKMIMLDYPPKNIKQ